MLVWGRMGWAWTGNLPRMAICWVGKGVLLLRMAGAMP
jgi:hypothetical protein